MWLDEKGVKQFSDRPPPASVPASRILKEAGRPTQQAQPAAGAQAAPDTQAGAPGTRSADKAPMTTAERNADFLKRRAEQSDKDKKTQEQAQLAVERAKHCEQAAGYQRTLERGERIARTDKNGERYFLTDEQRAREIGEYRRVLQDCK
jgi:hypothetical protein